ncbi:hypothetical protein J5N97_007964 [Dioscorea zingiberensis]|uniref:Clp protease n=1 Tax=Dioscorea zingiberensis TaxID=325984 RepID=A0A9D5DCV7_9LILI|nr:hypothetical protein J5N97_007964 [Dioscorea zingiberensis]
MKRIEKTRSGTEIICPICTNGIRTDLNKSNIRVMIHQPASSFYEAQAGEFILEAEELLKLRETLTRVYVQRTGNPLWAVSEDMERDAFMSATEAQAHGIVDLVAVENENTNDFV